MKLYIMLILLVLTTTCVVPEKKEITNFGPKEKEIETKHGMIYNFFHPAYLEGKPLWSKILFWAGPGHWQACRTATGLVGLINKKLGRLEKEDIITTQTLRVSKGYNLYERNTKPVSFYHTIKDF